MGGLPFTWLASRKQLNVRVSESVRDTIDAAVFVRDLRGPQELVEPALEQLAGLLRLDPLIQEALRLRARGRTARGASIHRLPSARDRRKERR